MLLLRLPEPKKTGLGSSAALVSSLVGALLSYMGLLDFTASKLGPFSLLRTFSQKLPEDVNG